MNLFCGDIVSFKQDSLWSWFICGLTTLCVILTIGFSSALGVLFPVFMNSFGENRESTGQFYVILDRCNNKGCLWSFVKFKLDHTCNY